MLLATGLAQNNYFYFVTLPTGSKGEPIGAKSAT